MGFFGRGKGPFGIPKSFSGIFYVWVLSLIGFVVTGIYLADIGNYMASITSVASALMFSGFFLAVFTKFIKFQKK